ncbi:MAG TPA: hypothetical protein V6D14_06710 [Coleofasciculaceae cyanobacterium]|jgi:hypothetical protein
MTHSKERITAQTLLNEFYESNSIHALNSALEHCRFEELKFWFNIHVQDLDVMPELLDFAPQLELAALLLQKRGFSFVCEETGEVLEEYDLTESPYYGNLEPIDEHLNGVHIIDPNYTVPRTVVISDNDIQRCVCDLLMLGDDSATEEDKRDFNALLEFCTLDTSFLSDVFLLWTAQLCVPSLDDAKVVKSRFEKYIQSALVELDSFWSLQIWIGTGESAVWYDRINLR